MFHICFRFCICMHKKQLNTRHLRMDCAQILDPSPQIADWSVLEMLCYINQNEEQNVKSWHLDYFSFFMPWDNHAKRLPVGEGKRGKNTDLFYPETSVTDIFLFPFYFSMIRYSWERNNDQGFNISVKSKSIV